MSLQPSCTFCQILQGKIDASIVYRDELVTSFMDIHPLIQGHVLVIPNNHFSSLAELQRPYGGHMFEIAHKMALSIRRSSLTSEGINLYLADGTAAGQSVFHCHLHVIPRFPGDGFKIQFPPTYSLRPAREELDRIAGQIRDALDLQ